MYKITNDLTEVTALNDARKVIENNPNVSYCEINKCSNSNLWAIPITDRLNAADMKALCNFLTDQWLSDIVSSLPNNWEWHFNKAIRVIIPNALILENDSLNTLINYIKITPTINYAIFENTSYIYIDQILTEHQTILQPFINSGEVFIENN